ncbi:MAG: ADP-ribosylglycohydrolase family protein [Bacillota bacterium]|nr:ADP-ribosylglycohydrolase family protein [Bacillota bacterium]
MSLTLAERVKGGLLGLAIGDALGTPLEFMTVTDILARYGLVTELLDCPEKGIKAGQTSDDTAMTVAVAEGILANPADPAAAVGERFLAWYEADGRGVGNQIRLVLEKYKACRNWQIAAKEAVAELQGLSAGNGALMRTLPVSYAYYRDREKMMQVSERLTRLTHYDDKAVACSLYYNLLVCRIMDGETRWAAYQQSLEQLGELRASWSENLEALAALNLVTKALEAIPELKPNSFKPTGYVVRTLVAAVWCWLSGRTFEESLISAVNLGGDTDTIGALTGGLAGTEWGYSALPRKWLDKLSGRAELEALAERLAALAAGEGAPGAG